MPGRSRSRPCAQADWKIVESRMCSRLLIGSASAPYQTEQACGRCLNPIAEQLGVAGHGRAWRGKRLENGDRYASRRAGRVDGELRRVLQARDARPVLSPGRQAGLPLCCLIGGKVSDALALPAGLLFVHPRCEVFRRETRKRQQKIAEVTLGIDDQCRNAVDGRFLDERQAETRLAAAGHANAEGVRHEILGVIEQQVIGCPVGREVVTSA